MKPYRPYRPYAPYLVSGGVTELRARSGIALDANTVRVTFSQCVDITDLTGIQVNIAGGGWEEVAAVASGSGTAWEFTTTTAIASGDSVEWQYLGAEDSIVDCVEAVDVGALGPITLSNPLTGTYLLLESGDNLLLESGDLILLEAA